MQMEVLLGLCKGDGSASFNPGDKLACPYRGEAVEYFLIRSGGEADARSGTAPYLQEFGIRYSHRSGGGADTR